MRIFVLWDLVSSAKWLSQKVTEWLGLNCLRVLFKIQLNHLHTFDFRWRIFFSRTCTCFPDHHLPSSFQNGPLGCHLFLIAVNLISPRSGSDERLFLQRVTRNYRFLESRKTNEDISIPNWKKKISVLSMFSD